MIGENTTDQDNDHSPAAPGDEGAGKSISRKLARGRYVVTPDEKPARTPSTKQRRSVKKGQGQRPQGKRPTKKPIKKRLPDDPDHQWLKSQLRGAQTVAEVLSRQVQYENKIRALKLRHEPGKPLHDYADRMEQFLARLKTFPWTTQLRDLRQDDSIIRKLKL